MEILSIEEQPDGSAIINANFTESEIECLLSYAVTNILKEEFERSENEHRANGSIEQIQSEESLKSEDL